MKLHVRAPVNMNGKRGDIKTQKWVMEHVQIRLQNVPIGLRDTISCFPAMDRQKFEWAMDESVKMSEVEPFLKGT